MASALMRSAGRRAIILALVGLLAACGDEFGDQRTDLQKLIEFHKKIVVIDREVDGAGDLFRSGSQDDMKRLDMFALYRDAKLLDGKLQSASLEALQLETPSLANPPAQDGVEKALNGLQTRIAMLQLQAETVMKMANSGDVSPADAASVQDTAAGANANALAETLAIVKAYQALGVPFDQVDGVHGGLDPKSRIDPAHK